MRTRQTYLNSEVLGTEFSAAGWSQRVGGFAVLPAIVEQLGGNANAALFRVGLAPDALDSADRRISYAGITRLLREIAHQTGCHHIGLLAGHAWHLTDLGLVGEIVRNAPTVGSALETLVVHQHLNTQGGLAFLRQRGGIVDLGYAIYHPQVIDGRHMYEAVLAVGCNLVRELAGEDWRPSEVLLPHSSPADATHYRTYFKVQPRFDQEVAALRFPEHWLRRAVAGADAACRRMAEERIRAAPDPDFIERLYRALRRLLLDDCHLGDDVARMLAMHRRTLNRRLHDLGTTFQQVLDAVRYDAARQLLACSEVPLDDIAASLGYAGVSPFMRSFRRWSGETPARWRRLANAMPAAGGSMREDRDGHHLPAPKRSSGAQACEHRAPVGERDATDRDGAGVAEDSDLAC